MLMLELNLSAVMAGQQRLDEAVLYAEQALRIAMEVEGSLQQAQALNNLGVIAAKQADWILAEQRLRRSHELKTQIFGPDHPDVMSSGINLANVLVQFAAGLDDGEQARVAYDEAEHLYARGVAFREQTDGPRSKSVARVLSMQGLLQRKRGDMAEARKTYERALKIVRGLPNTQQERISALINLASLERVEARLERACEYYEEVLTLRIELHGDGHPMVATDQVQLCSLLDESGEFERAVSYCEQATLTLESLPEDFASAKGVDIPAVLGMAKKVLTHARRP